MGEGETMKTTKNKTIDITQAIIETAGKEILNRAQTETLFRENAILIASSDVIEINRAIDLLGESAVTFAKNQSKGFNGYNGYGIGEYTLWYLTKEAFFIAVTYRNIDRIRHIAGHGV